MSKEEEKLKERIRFLENAYLDLCKEMLDLRIKLKKEEELSKTFLDEYNEGRS